MNRDKSASALDGSAVAAVGRSLAAVGGLAVVELLAVRAGTAGWLAVRRPGPASPAEAVDVAVLSALVLVGGWLLVSTVVALAAHLPGRVGGVAQRCSQAWVPTVTRRVAAVLVGAAVGSSLAPVVAAAESGAPMLGPGFAVTRSAPVRSGPLPGWTPSRPVHASAPMARLVAGGGRAAGREVVVHRGDSLWTIARRQLGPGATDAEVAAAWPRWYAANRDVVGPDPGRLQPGQVLTAPGSELVPHQAVGVHP